MLSQACPVMDEPGARTWWLKPFSRLGSPSRRKTRVQPVLGVNSARQYQRVVSSMFWAARELDCAGSGGCGLETKVQRIYGKREEQASQADTF